MTGRDSWQPYLTRSTPGWARSPAPWTPRPRAGGPSPPVAGTRSGRSAWRSFVRPAAPGWARGVLRLSADADAAATARRRMDEWLRGHRVLPQLVANAVLATSELVDNAVEHAYRAAEPGHVTLVAYLYQSRLIVMITDGGTWRPPAPGGGHRGRGLALVRAVADIVKIEHPGAGTRVTASFTALRTPAHAVNGHRNRA